MEEGSEEFFKNIDRISSLVARYESNETDHGGIWFDTEDIEDICNYYINAGNYSKAEKVLQLGERLHPGDETMPMIRANLLVMESKPEEALVLLDQYPHKEDYYWHYLRFSALVNLQRTDEAIAEADMVVMLDDDKVGATIDVALLFAETEHIDLAISYLERTEKSDTDEADKKKLYALLTQYYGESGKYEEALAYTEKWIDADPYSVNAWCVKATIELDCDRYENALNDYDFALAIDPQCELALVTKVRLLCLLSREEEALQVLDDMAEMTAYHKHIGLMLRGDIYFMKGDYRKAHSCYYKGFNSQFFIVDSAHRYMECKARLHKWRGVVSLGKFLLQVDPDDTEVIEQMADAYFELKEYQEAAKMFRRYIKLAPDDVDILLRYSGLLLDMDEMKKAYTYIHRAYKLAPDISQTNLLMAVVCYLRGEDKRMYRYYRKACSIDKHSKALFFQMLPEVEPYINGLDSIVRKYEKAGVTDIDRLLFEKK